MKKSSKKKPSQKEVLRKLDWDETYIFDSPLKKCKHVFQFTDEGECKCKHCGLGLMGVVDLMNGKPV